MIRLDNVTQTYKKSIVALHDISLEIRTGEFVFLVGASGSGKSTFIKLLLKEDNADEGDICVGGKRLSELDSWRIAALRRELGCVFHDFKMLEKTKGAENVTFALEVIGK